MWVLNTLPAKTTLESGCWYFMLPRTQLVCTILKDWVYPSILALWFIFDIPQINVLIVLVYLCQFMKFGLITLNAVLPFHRQSCILWMVLSTSLSSWSGLHSRGIIDIVKIFVSALVFAAGIRAHWKANLLCTSISTAFTVNMRIRFGRQRRFIVSNLWRFFWSVLLVSLVRR